MTPSGQSDTPRAGEEREYYVLLEYAFQGTMVLTIPFAIQAPDVCAAARRLSGYQLSRDCTPRRIRVYRERPIDFEWTRVDNYLCEVGEALR